MGGGIAYPQPGGAPVTATRKETADASPCVKQGRPGGGDIEVGEHGLMQPSQRQGDRRKNADPVTIENETLPPCEDLHGEGRGQQHAQGDCNQDGFNPGRQTARKGQPDGQWAAAQQAKGATKLKRDLMKLHSYLLLLGGLPVRARS